MKMRVRKIGLVGMLSFALVTGLTGWGKGIMIKSQVAEHTLENGLKVVVQVDRRAPIASVHTWYRVGSADEVRGITGISHALEHMMFRGTPKYPNDTYSEIIAKNGGRDNAFTTQDFTGYYANIEKSKVALCLELEADRMQNLTLDSVLYQLEMKAVREERRLRTEDSPKAVTFERFLATAHANGPYHHPVIGWMDDLHHFTQEDLRRWYQQYYVPNNATIIVIGDVEPKQIFELVHKYFGGIAKKTLPQPLPGKDIAPLGEKRIKVEYAAELPFLVMGYQVPSMITAKESWEPYALAVLANALDGGESARFAKNLMRDQEVCASCYAHYDFLQRYDTQFILRGTPSANKSVYQLEQAINTELTKLKTEKLALTELNRIKTQLIAEEIYSKDSITDQAEVLGTFESIGSNWQISQKIIDNIQAVTATQVQQVAQKYLVANRLTVAELVPIKNGRKNHAKK